MLASSTRLKIITQFFPPDYAPTGQLVAELAQKLSKRDLSVSVFTSKPAYAYNESCCLQDLPATEAIGNVQVRRSRACQLWDRRVRGKALSGVVFFLRSVLHLLRRGRQSDVLLLTTAPPFLPILGYFMHRLLGVRYVCLLYDIYPDIAIRFGIFSADHWLSRLWTKLNRQTWRQAQAVIVLSPSMQQQILSLEPSIADRLFTIHNWADPSQIIPIPKHRNWFAAQHDLVQHFTVLYSGNMGRCHDLSTFIHTAAALRHDPVKFLFIGDGPQIEDLKALVSTLQLANVAFLPYQDRSTLPWSLTACDLSLVSIDQRMEGLVAPSKFYSALAAGRPIAALCGRSSYLRDLIETAQCGQSFANGDSQGLVRFIHHLMRKPEVAARLGIAGRRYCETHFTPEIIAQQYQQVLFPAGSSVQKRPHVSTVRTAPLPNPTTTQTCLEWLGPARGTGPETRESHSL